MYFQNIYALWLIPLLGIMVWYVKYKHHTPGLLFSWQGLIPQCKRTWRIFIAENMVWIRIGALLLCIIALARPQMPLEESKVQTEGIDIVLAVDVSGSMLAEDFVLGKKRVNRLAAVKNVVSDFIQGRSNDRIGLVAFAARPYTVCPLTLDYGWLLENMERLEVGMIEDGTAIGAGLSTALNRLRDTRPKGKVVILLTDGRNNAGNITPQIAAEAAKALQVKVYTIGAGTKGLAPYPVKDFFGNQVYQSMRVDIDEETLQTIASVTGGQYFRATDTESLKEIYKEIDRLEKTDIEEKGYLEYKELFPYVVIPGLALLLFELFLSFVIVRRLP